jgi:ubiquinone/menaquinone biosynthesis C-methylase UbiE
MPRRPDRLVRCWDRQADRYDSRTARLERRFIVASRHWICSRVQGTTLEVAVGTGANLPHYPADVELTGVDWSEAMLDVARRRAEQLRRPARLLRADAGALPFPDASFDTVVSTFALCCVPDVRAALVEALRVLRPDGRLLLADHVASSCPPVRAVQHLIDLVTVPLQGEHYARRPRLTLEALGASVVESERAVLGAVEHLHARRPD